MASTLSGAASSQTASRALSYFTERAEDAQSAFLGILGHHGPGANAGSSGADRYLTELDIAAGPQGVQLVRNKLESSSEHDRLDGLRTVVAVSSWSGTQGCR